MSTQAIKNVIVKPFHTVTVEELKAACTDAGISFDDCCPGCIRNAYSALVQSFPELLQEGKGKAKFKFGYTGYRFHGDTTMYTNANLTDEVARAILKVNPGAHVIFEVLPDEVTKQQPEIEEATKQSTSRRKRS